MAACFANSAFLTFSSRSRTALGCLDNSLASSSAVSKSSQEKKISKYVISFEAGILGWTHGWIIKTDPSVKKNENKTKYFIITPQCN